METTRNRPQLSFIIPVYNRERLVVETLRSIQGQTRTDWEAILVDDHSTDGTFSVLERFCEEDSRFRCYRRPETVPKGPSACRNYGFTQAKGTFIHFFDSDDLLTPDFMEAHLGKLEEDEELDYLLLRFARFQADPNQNRVSSGKPENMTIPEAMAAFRVEQGTQCFLWRKSFLDFQDRLWREDLSYGEDRELYFRLVFTARTGKMSEDPVCILYRINKKGICRSRRSRQAELSDYFELYTSVAESCKRTGQSEETERYIAKYLWKGMRLSCRYGITDYLVRFNELAEKLHEFPKYKKRRRRIMKHLFFNILYYRTGYLFMQIFRTLAHYVSLGYL